MAILHVLRRLPAWSGALAATRPCVGKAPWRALNIVGRRFLNTHKVHGLFINYIDHDRPHLFARPSSMSPPTIDAMLHFLPDENGRRLLWSVLDHSSGLLLCEMRTPELCVCNPATRRWTFTPWASRPVGGGIYLAFDPGVSPHYEVLVIHAVPEPEKPAKRANGKRSKEKPPSLDPPCADEDNDTRLLMESKWPPTPWTLNVFSSRTGQWEERAFVRQGEAAGTVRDMLVDRVEASFGGPRQRYAVYWQGTLYVHCRGFFVLRLSCSSGTYQVIKMPAYNHARTGKPYLGNSEKGVYFGIVEESPLQVWILNESRGEWTWILKCQDDLGHYAQHLAKYDRQMDAPWIIYDLRHTNCEDKVATKTLSRERFEWDSDNDDFFTSKSVGGDYIKYFEILGFHPYKEVVYLSNLFGVVAYHVNCSKVQYLGNSRPKSYYNSWTNGIFETFIYTPCMIGELNGNKDQSSS